MFQLALCARMIALQGREVVHKSMVDYRRARSIAGEVKITYKIMSATSSRRMKAEMMWVWESEGKGSEERMDEMFDRCARYLSAFKDAHRFDGLFTGRRRPYRPALHCPFVKSIGVRGRRRLLDASTEAEEKVVVETVILLEAEGR